MEASYESCPVCGEVAGELIEMRGRRVCQSCIQEGLEGDTDYWRAHHHEPDAEPLEWDPLDSEGRY